ncbi:hypothetical protein RBB80_18810 [Tunturiibacter gelidiferens]
MGVAVGGFGVAHAAKGGDDVVLRVVLAGVDDVVDGVGFAEGGVRSIAVGGGDPATTIGIFAKFCVAEVLAGEEAELPEVIGDVLADVGDGAVGADDDLGVFVGEAGGRGGGICGIRHLRVEMWGTRFIAGAAHDVTAFVFAGGLEVEDTFFEHECAGRVPEVEGQDLALAGEEVVLDVEALHGLEVTAKDGGGDEVGYVCGVVLAELEGVEGVEADLLACVDVFGIGGVPLGDSGVEIPAVEVDALVGLEELGEEFAGAGECFAFEVDEAYDYVCDLDAGVVDVILNADFVAGFEAVGTEEALEGVAEDGVAEVANVSGFVGVDAGVLDEAEAWAADVGVLVVGDAADGGGAVEADVEVACAGYFYACYAFERGEDGGEFGG